jgi:selenocysteine lyase/cysteine desulfurase
MPDDDALAADEFLLEPGLSHFNTGTLGAMPRLARERMAAAQRRFETNPVLHAYKLTGDAVLADAERARARCAQFLGCPVDELLVTHGAADGLGQVAASIDLRPGERILTSGAEHDSGVLCWQWLARRRGGHVDVVPIAPEETDTDAIVRRVAAALRPQTRVVCVSDVVAWTGLRLPLRALADLAHAHGALMIADGAQAAGHMPVDVAALGCDAYAASGHKWLLGPKGSGLLHVRKDPAQRIFPVAWESGPRLNSEAMGGCALPQAIGLGAAVEWLEQRTVAATLARNAALRDELYVALQALPGVRPVGPPPGTQPTAMVGFRLPDRVDAIKLRTTLFAKHRITLRVVDDKQWHGLRASVHVYNDARQVAALVEALRVELA